MLRCPACGEIGIAEHSVLAKLEAVSRLGSAHVPVFSRCARCGSTFMREGPDIRRARLRPVLEEPTILLTPPWLDPGNRSEFERSWDAIALFYEQYIGDTRLEPLCALVDALRADGYARRLRAGQSMYALGLSRSPTHGLRPEQNQLWLRPHSDGRVMVDGSIDNDELRFGPIPATLGGRLLDAIERLANSPLG